MQENITLGEWHFHYQLVNQRVYLWCVWVWCNWQPIRTEQSKQTTDKPNQKYHKDSSLYGNQIGVIWVVFIASSVHFTTNSLPLLSALVFCVRLWLPITFTLWRHHDGVHVALLKAIQYNHRCRCRCRRRRCRRNTFTTPWPFVCALTPVCKNTISSFHIVVVMRRHFLVQMLIQPLVHHGDDCFPFAPRHLPLIKIRSTIDKLGRIQTIHHEERI